MSQLLHVHQAGQVCELRLPDPDAILCGDVRWGRADELLTPAFWAYRCAQHTDIDDKRRFRVTSTLAEEYAVCMLAGYGVPAEVGIAAAARLREEGLLTGCARPQTHELEAILRAPLDVSGRTVRYRFYQTKARYLSIGLQALAIEAPDEARALDFRAWFDALPGVGPKTASFITRNWLGSDQVAILDVHVQRACQIFQLFPAALRLASDYGKWEQRFLLFAQALGVKASLLDAVIWDDMRSLDRDIIECALASLHSTSDRAAQPAVSATAAILLA